MRKLILLTISDTQRLTVLKKEDSLVIQKEWRKTQDESWHVNKGIELPSGCMNKLRKMLDSY